MAAILVFHLVIMSGSALCCAGFDRRFEELVPLTGIGLVFVLFLFGLAGKLTLGVYAVLALALSAWVLAGWAIRKNGFRVFARRFFTPGFWVFVFLAVSLLFFNYGRVVASWDDFTHWADIIKVMLSVDGFGTQAGSHALFPEYPPELSLFLYFPQRLAGLFGSGGLSAEWALFYAQQLFYFSFFLPFMRAFDFRRPYTYVFLLLLFLLPLNISMHELVYQRLTVDTFMAVVYACTVALCIAGQNRDLFFRAEIALNLAFLSSFKGLGIVFALSAAVLFLVTESAAKRDRAARARLGLGIFGAALVPCVVWNTYIHLWGGKKAFPLTLTGLSPESLLGEGHYRLECVKSFIKAFLEKDMAANVETNSLWLSPIFLLALLMALLLLCLRLYRRQAALDGRAYKRIFWWVLAVSLVQIFSICLAYMFAFSVKEAVDLACFERYVGSVLLALGFLLLLLAADLIRQKALDGTLTAALLFCVQALLSPWTPAMDFTLRGGVAYSQAFCQSYQGVLEQAAALTGGNPSRFFLISSDSVDKIALRYELRPHTVQIDQVDQTEFLDLVWDYGVPAGYDGREGLSPAEAWMEDLKEHYDYVLIFQLNDALAEKFGPAFANPAEIQAESIYRVNDATGQLELCPRVSSASGE